MSKKTLLTPNPLSKDVKISWVIDNSWLMQESPGWKPISLSNILPQIGSKETG